MIDLHSHILPGLDDGAATLTESVELARAAAEAGVVAIAATPHVRHDFPTAPAEMEAALEEVRAAVAAAGIPIRVLPGGEVDFEQLGRHEPEELRRFGLGGNPGYLLVETPYAGWPLALEDRLFELHAAGITPVLAHPERNPEVRADPARVLRLVASGTLVQLTAASLARGSRSRETAFHLLAEGGAHLVAGDLHGAAIRRPGLETVGESLGDPALADWLTMQVPAAIVDGVDLPPRPEPTARRRRFRLF